MKKFIPLVFFLLLLFAVLAGIVTVFKAMTTPAPKQTTDTRVKLEEAKAKLSLNKEYTFSFKDTKGKETATFTYVVDSVELRNDIVVKGRKATAIAGRTFLIVNLKLTNPKEQPISVNTSTYIRLSVNDNEKELLAPDIHNDPVTVQPLSTKITRVGFPINDTDKGLKLHVGEITKEKEAIDIVFP